MQRFTRTLLMLVALSATMHGLLHTHAIAASYTDHAATAAQTCVLCVSAQSSLHAAPVRIAPPAAETVAQTAPDAISATRAAETSVPSRAPPRV